ncbi:hypothetical protein GMRT_24496 [Giardia muris]|uniref:Uncharacterized protein n=1 Tax=Giardia muris TaxID=5742 RepID=A0A4Z1SRI4_GIAMU|nr:hypothetical protein GMRT_24496 [Giardia muris]|eukprot:TNJ26238.1 hypothetical protein GMRT_24496 [Giardia muris]
MDGLVQVTEYVVDERDVRPLRNTVDHLTLQLPKGAKADLRTTRHHILSNLVCGKRMLKSFMEGAILVPDNGTTFGRFITEPISDVFHLDVNDSILSNFSSASNTHNQEDQEDQENLEGSHDGEASVISLTSGSISPPLKHSQ